MSQTLPPVSLETQRHTDRRVGGRAVGKKNADDDCRQSSEDSIFVPFLEGAGWVGVRAWSGCGRGL